MAKDTLADMTVEVIDQLHSHDHCLSKIWERRWIRTLKTSHPFGMNLRVDSLCNLLDDHLWTTWIFTSLIDINATGLSEEVIMYWMLSINTMCVTAIMYTVYWSGGWPQNWPKHKEEVCWCPTVHEIYLKIQKNRRCRTSYGHWSGPVLIFFY